MPKHQVKKGRKAIGKKIKKLKAEGKAQKQAVGQALGMAREGDLGKAAQVSTPSKPKSSHRPRTVRV